MDFTPVFEELYANNSISLELADKLNEINLDVIENRLTSEELLSKVNSLRIEDFSEKDEDQIVAFTQVFNASYQFWTQNSNLSPEKGPDCNDAIIMADAAGGVVRFAFRTCFLCNSSRRILFNSK